MKALGKTFLAGLLIMIAPAAHAFGFPFFNGATMAQNSCIKKNGTTSDLDNAPTGFGGGTYSNTRWDGNKIVLSSGQITGTYTSRVLDSGLCQKATPWTNFSWSTPVPNFKEIPATSETSATYPSKILNLMTGIVGLWHLNEGYYSGSSDDVIDSSGNGYHGRLFGTAGRSPNSALMNNGMTWFNIDDDTDYLRFTLPARTETQTFQAWYKSPLKSDFNTYTSLVNASNIGWTLVANPTGGIYLRIDTSAFANQTQCAGGTAVFEDNQWHHVAFTINNGSCSFYLDGVLKRAGPYVRGTGFPGASELRLSGGPGENTVDEAALWSRVLSDDEIYQLYLRGANKNKFQVRTCTGSRLQRCTRVAGPRRYGFNILHRAK